MGRTETPTRRRIQLALLLVLAGCGSSRPAPEPRVTPASHLTPCSETTTKRCILGVDGCATGATTFHVCILPNTVPGPKCTGRVTYGCTAGLVDACSKDPPLAPNHLCVIESAFR